jgi:hypothetical protein
VKRFTIVALALALAITVVTTYVPKLASEFTGSTTVIGLIVGAEGFLALFVGLITLLTLARWIARGSE